jgi:hypothetical protein
LKLCLATLAGLSTLVLITDCVCAKPPVEPPITYVEAGAPVVKDLCTLLEGWTENQTVISICATVEEVLTIASTLVPPLSAEAADAGVCTPLPGTTACAMKRQIGRGIQMVLLQRRARLLRDAGAEEAGR